MGKIPQGILGGVSGKIGGVVGSSWKGINVLKTLPLSVANPKTAKQIKQRTMFGNSVKFSKQLLGTVIKPLWDRFADRQSGFNAFISTNINHFDGKVSPAPGSGFQMSKGKMIATPAITHSVDDTQELTITWDNALKGNYQQNDDEMYIVAFKPANELAEGVSQAAQRNDGTVSVNLSDMFEDGDTYVVQFCFKRADGTIVSAPTEVTGTVT